MTGLPQDAIEAAVAAMREATAQKNKVGRWCLPVELAEAALAAAAPFLRQQWERELLGEDVKRFRYEAALREIVAVGIEMGDEDDDFYVRTACAALDQKEES